MNLGIVKYGCLVVKGLLANKEVALNDVMAYDAIRNTWKTIAPSSGQIPTPRFGHILFCYFQYLIVFGGQSESGRPMGDLWVFDTIAEKWTFILDTDDTHEQTHYDIEGYMPRGRMFASGVTFHNYALGIITGGYTTEGIACDIWGIELDNLVSFVEDRNKNPYENFWIKKKLRTNDLPNLCRQGHVSAIIGQDEFVVYGGVDQNNNFMSTSYSYNIVKNQINSLVPTGDTPEPRIKCGILSTSMGMVILYGGAQIEGKGYYTDLWHFVVKDNRITFKQIDKNVEGDNLFMTWRHGFTMHHVRGEQDPILIGGTYGNNQQSQALVTLPEQK